MEATAISLLLSLFIKSIIETSLVAYIDKNNPNQTEGQAYRNADFCVNVANNTGVILFVVLLFIFYKG